MLAIFRSGIGYEKKAIDHGGHSEHAAKQIPLWDREIHIAL